MKDISFDEFNASFQATTFNLELTGSEVSVIIGALTILQSSKSGPITELLLKISKQVYNTMDDDSSEPATK